MNFHLLGMYFFILYPANKAGTRLTTTQGWKAEFT